jgi:hypothetical protein
LHNVDIDRISQAVRLVVGRAWRVSTDFPVATTGDALKGDGYNAEKIFIGGPFAGYPA